jgi:DNA-binding response OmpR family regulator
MVVLILELDQDYADVAAHIAGQVPGLAPRVVHSQKELWQGIRGEPPVAIVADQTLLRGVRGVEAVRSMSTAALVVATPDLQDAAALMEAGADYVLPKPYAPAILKATLRAILRRRQAERRSAGRVLEVGPLLVEPSRRSAQIEGQRHLLSPREADLLEYLAINAGVVLSRRQIIEGAWSGDHTATPASVTMCIHRLRQKLEPNPSQPRLLRTRRSNGYVLEAIPGAEPQQP